MVPSVTEKGLRAEQSYGSLRPPAAAASRLVSSRPVPPLCSSVVLHIRGGCPPSISQVKRSQSLNGPWAVTLEILRGGFFIFIFFIFVFYKNIFPIWKFTGIYPGRPAAGRPGPGRPAAGRQGLL